MLSGIMRNEDSEQETSTGDIAAAADKDGLATKQTSEQGTTPEGGNTKLMEQQTPPVNDDKILEKDDPPPEIIPDPFQPIPVHIETTIRMTLACFAAYSLAVADLPSIIPSTQSWIIGILGPTIVMRLPTVLATLGGIGLCYTILFFGLASITVMLYAATVSDGFFIAVVAIWSLWIAPLRFGSLAKLTWVVAPVLAAFVGIIGLDLHRVVRDGINLKLSSELIQDLIQELAPGAMGNLTTSELVASLQEINLEALVQSQLDDATLLARAAGALDNLTAFLDLVREGILLLIQLLSESGQQQGAIAVTIPLGLFEGRDVFLSLSEDRDLFISLEGGAYLIRLFWTAGVMNPIAVFPNFIVAGTWAILCVALSPLLPPFRTTRFLIARRILPQVLYDAAWYIQGSSMDEFEGVDQRKTADIVAIHRRLVLASTSLRSGTVAAATAFEPRCFANVGTMPRCTWVDLKNVTVSVQNVATKALAFRAIGFPDCLENRQAAKQAFRGTARALQKLQSHDTLDLQKVQVQETKMWNFEKDIEMIRSTTDNWIQSMTASENNISLKEGITNSLKCGAMWFALPVALLWRVLQTPFIPIQIVQGKYKTTMAKIFHCIKFAFGFTLLAIFSVYWESYREIDVSSPSQQTNFELVVGTPPSSFAGWELLAYSFATMPTAEGTIKKCVMRVFGTCCGGLSAWLLILAAGDNPYGTVAWLTGTAALGILLSVEKDESARFGQSRDFGYAGFYFVLTQSVIVFDFRVGLGSRNELVANRIAANLLGIGMACVLAMIPPRVLGARPEYADQLLTKISQSLDQTMLLAIDEAPSETYTELRITHEEEASLLYSTATYLLEDAKRLSKFPIFKVDHQLEELMLELVTTSCILSIWWDYIARLISEDEKTSHGWQTAFKAVFELSLHVCVTPKTDVTGSVLDEEHRFLANAFAVVKRRLETHARVIKQIREMS